MHLFQECIQWRLYDGNISLLNDDIHIFKINSEVYAQIININSLLSAHECERAFKIKHLQSKKNYIVGKHFSKLILSRFLNTNPKEIIFYKKNNNKPYVDGIFFNIAHTNNHVFIAVSTSEIGIDAEYIDPNFEYEDILTSCFSKSEILFVKNDPMSLLNFYFLWTRKEALLKATGEGLNNVLEEIPSLNSIVHRNNRSFKMKSIKDESPYAVSIAHDPKITNLIYWTFPPISS